MIDFTSGVWKFAATCAILAAGALTVIAWWIETYT